MSDKLLKFVENFGPTLLASAAILVIGIIVSKLLLKFIAKALKKSRLEPTGHAFLLSVLKVVFYIIVIIMALTKLGVPMTSIVAMITAAGLAVSLAIKENLSNVAGGFIVMMTRPFKVGDYIKIGEAEGNVTAISIMYTRLLTLDTRAVLIPNSTVANSTITNFTQMPHRRLEMHFSISYSDNYRRAKELIEAAIKAEPRTLDTPDKPLIAMDEHGASAVDILVRVWVNTNDYWPVRYELLRAVKQSFDDEGITIPFNQLDVHLDNLEGRG